MMEPLTIAAALIGCVINKVLGFGFGLRVRLRLRVSVRSRVRVRVRVKVRVRVRLRVRLRVRVRVRDRVRVRVRVRVRDGVSQAALGGCATNKVSPAHPNPTLTQPQPGGPSAGC
jgi:hypothetical protein